MLKTSWSIHLFTTA